MESLTAENRAATQNAADSQPELRTAKQVRKQLGDKSEVTLWRWVNDPELGFPKPIKIRGQNHFNGAAIDRWIASQTGGA